MSQQFQARGGSAVQYKKANEDSDWKNCVRSMDETKKIIESCHAGVGGRYSIYKQGLSASQVGRGNNFL